MFWKKKKALEDKIIYETSSRRKSYRYFPKNPREFGIRFKGKNVDVINISAGGLAFNNREFSSGDTDRVNLELNDPDLKKKQCLTLSIKLLTIDKTHACHCIFDSISQDEMDIIHQYLFIKQKRDIREKRGFDSPY